MIRKLKLENEDLKSKQFQAIADLEKGLRSYKDKNDKLLNENGNMALQIVTLKDEKNDIRSQLDYKKEQFNSINEEAI